MTFDWTPESKDRYFQKAEAAVREAGYSDILIVDKERFAVTKDVAKVYFCPIRREGNTRRYRDAKRVIKGLEDNSSYRNSFGKKKKMIFIHAHMLIDLEKRDR